MTPADRTELLTLLSAYCDDTLDAAGLDRLESVLTDSPAARRVYAEYLDVHARLTARRGAVVSARRPARPGQWVWAAGLVGVAAALFVAVRPAGQPTGPAGVVTDRAGPVQVSPDGRMVATIGAAASAVVTYPGGASVTLGGDTVAEIADGPTARLSVRRGAVAATVPAAAGPLVVSTDAATAVAAAGSRLTVDAGRAEFGVQAGTVRVTAPDDRPPTDMSDGELCTVGTDGTVKRPLSAAPDEYAWDLTRPLPDGWQAGTRTPRATVRPELWFDPYPELRRRVWQVRSDNQWLHGLFACHPDTRVRLTYRTARPPTDPRNQTVIVLRPDPQDGVRAVVRNWTGVFNGPTGQWRTVERTLADIPLTETSWVPPAGLRQVGFLCVLNTFDDDLGLEVKEFRVFRPGEPAP